MTDSDAIFKALADPSRRTLLDRLFQQDGQTLSELQAYLPMSRFGTMKHLRILEDAGLIVTRKVGREKRHYLNPVPIQLVYDRWVSKYARPWALALTGLKYALEERPMDAKPAHLFEVYIRTTPERLWQALTDKELTAQYYFGSGVISTWEPGSTYRFPTPGGTDFATGENLEVDPPRKLVQTFRILWAGPEAAEHHSRCTWEITPMGGACKLTLTHEQLAVGPELEAGIVSGWNQILSGLKTLLETGEPLMIAQP